MDGSMGRWMVDGWTSGWWMDGKMGGWTNELLIMRQKESTTTIFDVS